MRDFWDGVRWWPKHASVKEEYRHLSVREIIQRGRAQELPEPSTYTLAKHRQRLSVFLNDLVEAKILTTSPLTKNLLKTSSEDEEATGRPFTDDELRKIFDPAAHRWGIMLGIILGIKFHPSQRLIFFKSLIGKGEGAKLDLFPSPAPLRALLPDPVIASYTGRGMLCLPSVTDSP